MCLQIAEFLFLHVKSLCLWFTELNNVSIGYFQRRIFVVAI